MAFFLIFVFSLITQFFLPWWIIGPVAFVIAAWKSLTGRQAFLAGFLAIFTLWVVVALFKTLPNDNILANRVAQMFMLPPLKFNWIVMLLITGLTGGIAGGLAALSGFYFRLALARKSQDEVSLQQNDERNGRNIFDKIKRTV